MFGENVVSYSTAINIVVAWVILMFFLHLSFAFAAVEDDISRIGTIRQRQTLVTPRIVGGTNAPPHAFPFFAQWMRGCGGSLIHDDLVLTAGHCLEDSRDLSSQIYIGNHESGIGNTVRRIVDYALHPRFDFENDFAYDFLILKLNRPVQLEHGNTLVTLNSDPRFPTQQELLTVVGFGHTHEDSPYTSDYLQQVQVPHVPDCTPFYNPGKIRPNLVLCAGYPEGGKDSCQADSGGPLLAVNNNKYIQVGLVSWGRGCARPNSPGVYARISTAHSWIQHQICMLSAVPPSHCVTDIQLDIHYNLQARQPLEWSLLDAHSGKEVTAFTRGSILHQSTQLSLPAGSYQLYLRDVTGMCCSFGTGTIVIRQKSNVIAQHSALFEKELYVNFDVGSGTNNGNGNDKDGNEDTHARYHPELLIPIYTNPPTVTPTTLSPTPGPSTLSPTQMVTDTITTSSSSSSSPSSILRIEILYDLNAEETGWFLIDKDFNQELFASKFNKQQQNEDNVDKGLQWDVTELDITPGHSYWFVLADAGMNGIDHGRVLIVYQQRVIWEHNGQFQSFVEAHFEL